MSTFSDRLKSPPFVVAVDFDGVLHAYSKGWYDGTIYDDPCPGARESMQALLDRGWTVIIYSVRAYDRVIGGVFEKNQIRRMAKWLKKHGIPYSYIYTSPWKPLAHVYIDDRAIRHQDWKSTMAILDGIEKPA